MEVEKVIRRDGESATVNMDREISNALSNITSDVNKNVFPYGLQKPFPGNCLTLMTATGAKGGDVSFSSVRTQCTILLIYLESRLNLMWNRFICLDRSTCIKYHHC